MRLAREYISCFIDYLSDLREREISFCLYPEWRIWELSRRQPAKKEGMNFAFLRQKYHFKFQHLREYYRDTSPLSWLIHDISTLQHHKRNSG